MPFPAVDPEGDRRLFLGGSSVAAGSTTESGRTSTADAENNNNNNNNNNKNKLHVILIN